MTMYKNNPIPVLKRAEELVLDYLVILLYLVLLCGVTLAIYAFFFHGIPEMSETQAQMVALLTSVIPVVLIFSFLDYSRGGSLGKRKAGLRLVFCKEASMSSSLVRNCVKFLPWQIGHMSTIHGIYTNFDSLAIVLSSAGIICGLALFFMTFLRADKRHVGDLLAGTQVQVASRPTKGV